MNRVLSFVIAAAALAALPVGAQEPQPLTSAKAVRGAQGHVELTVSWQGGACEAAGTVAVDATEADETTDAVTIPTVSTAEVCTMQIVPVEFSGLVPVEPHTENLAITVLAPNGQVLAGGSVAIERTGD